MSCQRGLLSIKLTSLIDTISLDDHKDKVTSLQGTCVEDRLCCWQYAHPFAFHGDNLIMILY
jgi:hypothetical protein